MIENKAKGLRLVGHNAQKTSFSSGAIIVKQIGHAVLTVNETESYLITFPRLRIDGLWYGSPYIELAETSYIVGGGYITSIEYKGKGYFSGKSHTFKSTTTPIPGQGGAGPREIVVEGTWHESSKFTKGGAGTFYEVEKIQEETEPLEWTSEIGELETRRLWFLVAKGIREGDFELASREKTRIEASTFLKSFTSLFINIVKIERATTTQKGRGCRRDHMAIEALYARRIGSHMWVLSFFSLLFVLTCSFSLSFP